MADPVVADTLKEFASKITTSKVSERQRILGALVPCVSKPDFPENGIKGVFKHLLFTLGRYHDAKSRHAVEEVVKTLATSHSEATIKFCTSCLVDIAERQKKITPRLCDGSSAEALNALSWSCLVVRLGLKGKDACSGDVFNKLVSVQSLLLYGALGTEKKVITNAAYKRMKRVWIEVPGSVDKYAASLQQGEKTIYDFCMIGCIIKFLSSTKNKEVLETIKPGFLDQYVKVVLSSRTKPDIHALESCKLLLKHATHEEFKQQMVPAVQKSMLRNPEIILQAFTNLIHGVTLDLSQYVLDLGKILATQLRNKEESFREEAAFGCKCLAKQCSDQEAVKKLVKCFFDVLGGSEGKVTGTGERMGLLTGIGNLSYNGVSGSAAVQNLSGNVVELFIPVLTQEAHEATLVHCLAQLTLWCHKFPAEVPIKVTQWFQKGIGLKSSTSAVRNAYFKCVSAAFHGDTLLQGLDLLPQALQSLEKGSSQSSQQPPVTEALSAACFIAKLSMADIQVEAKLEPFWTVILDCKKKLFVNNKFLTGASTEALENVSVLVERLVLDHPQKIQGECASMYYKALVFCLTHGSWQSRRQAQASCRKILAVLGGAAISLDILREFRQVLNTQEIVDCETFMADGSGDHQKFIKSSLLVECLASITNIPNPDRREAEQIALEAMEDAHHPCIVHCNPDAWTDLVAKLKLDAPEFIGDHLEDIINSIKNQENLSKGYLSLITTLVRVSPRTVLPTLIGHVTSLLRNPQLSTVTRKECDIMVSPEGELFDKKILESASQQQDNVSNMKRENKLYSYQDQLAELEIRKELEEKKRAKGLIKAEPVKLTKKQQELVDATMKTEAEIRGRMKELHGQVVKACSLISCCCLRDVVAVREYVTELLDTLMPLVQSPLAAPIIIPTYQEMATAVFPKDQNNTATLLAFATLRLMDAAVDLEPCWCQEGSRSQVTRVIGNFYTATVPESLPYPAPTFAYCFYLLKMVLRDGGSCVGGDTDILQRAVEIISTHAKLRSSETTFDEMSPETLPRREMLSLLVKVIGSLDSGKLQQMASRALLEVAMSGSGLEGCAAAEQDEIEVLLEGLQSSATAVRETSIMGLLAMAMVLPTPDIDYTNGLNLVRRVWVARCDVEQDNRKLADKLWEETGMETDGELCMLLVDDIIHVQEVVRQASSEALAKIIDEYQDYLPAVLQVLLEKYNEKLYVPPAVLDPLGRIISEALPDTWESRSGVAIALGKIAQYLTNDQIEPLFSFFTAKGLGDRHADVRRCMLDAAVIIINEHGKENVSVLLPVFEDFLSLAPDSESFDAVRQSVVILMGSLAKHLDKDDPKVKPIVAKLIETLSTPSKQVQESVANCLPPLVPAIKADAPDLVHKLLRLLLESGDYGERRGAAYGLAGLVKGLGILSLKQLDIMSTLQEAIQNKKNSVHREGALFAFEMLCSMLGRLFEPYVVNILPHLLLCFGDTDRYVREAADETAKAVMSKLSAHGVKLLLPSLLQALEEDSWRTKTGSVELLGAMAFCAPKQLSTCLPSIVPKLSEVLVHSHVKVRKAGAQALEHIGSVIRNPEIQALVPHLLEALQDPSKKTTACLALLLETKFVHFIDAPSLALIMPIVQRAFMDRSTETKKMAAQIIGNMYSLTDQKDLAPYLPSVVPGLKAGLVDPMPEVRTVSAHALGAMVKSMGENSFEDLLPWLMKTLTSEQNPVDRSGAAQGLSEVVGGLGVEKLHKLMPDIIHTAEREDIAPHVRDGYIMMYIYLPAVFTTDFLCYVGPIIPSVLKALADECEYVRDTAMRAGQRIVDMYADTAILLLLPELENGLFNENWRIRYSSVQLLGDLLFKISGVTGKMTSQTASEDDNFGTESQQQAILKVLGVDRRNRVLAGLYMGRSDTALTVRQAALHVWKVVVTNTPRTLREILSTLFSLLLGCLASTSYDKRQVAARTLGDIVRKLGERVLPEIIPILEQGLESDQRDQRQGVCIGLTEIMASTSKEHVMVFADSLVPTVRKALCDPLPEVREAAAKTFDNLHTNIGNRALNDILPDLLDKLGDEEMSEYALDGLTQVMAVKSRVVLPYIVPQLTEAPVNTRALAFLSSVAGEALTKHLGRILPALMSSLSEKMGTPDEREELEYCQTVVLSVVDDLGLRTVMDELLGACQDKNPNLRCAAVTILHAFCSQTRSDYSEYVPQLLRGLILLFTDSNDRVLLACWECLNAVTKKLDASEMLQHISNVRQAVRFAVSDLKDENLPGFCIPKKGITPILPIFREGILNGPPELKENASIGLGEVINRTSAEALKPSVVNITGPLIRILGDRFSFNVKVAVLDTLGLLLGKCGPMLKPFLPQLQTTFLKALNDPNRAVRLKAGMALGKLIIIHTRVDPLFTELHSGIKNSDDPAIRDTTLHALRGCIGGAGSKMSEALRKQITQTLSSLLGAQEDTMRSCAAGCLGALCKYLPEEELYLVLNLQILDNDSSMDWMMLHGHSVALSIAVKDAAETICVEDYASRVQKTILETVAADRIPLCTSGLKSLGYLLQYQLAQGSVDDKLVLALSKAIKHDSNEVKELAARVVSYLAGLTDQPLDTDTFIKPLLPILILSAKEKNTLVRTNSEAALVALLQLRQGDGQVQKCLGVLDAASKSMLNEMLSKTLNKMAKQAETAAQEDLDDTLLK